MRRCYIYHWLLQFFEIGNSTYLDALSFEERSLREFFFPFQIRWDSLCMCVDCYKWCVDPTWLFTRFNIIVAQQFSWFILKGIIIYLYFVKYVGRLDVLRACKFGQNCSSGFPSCMTWLPWIFWYGFENTPCCSYSYIFEVVWDVLKHFIGSIISLNHIFLVLFCLIYDWL